MRTIHVHQPYRDFGTTELDTRPATIAPTRWECEPDHVPWLLRGEYKWLRKQGVAPRVARWHVSRMLDMLFNGNQWAAVPTSSTAPDGFTLTETSWGGWRRYVCDECAWSFETFHPLDDNDRERADEHYLTEHDDDETSNCTCEWAPTEYCEEHHDD